MNDMKFMLNLFIAVLLIAGMLYLPKAILLYSGYCWEEGRYLTNQEKIDIAVKEVINQQSRRWSYDYTVNEAGGKVYLRNEKRETFRYSNLKEFYALNQNCCDFLDIYLSGETYINIPFIERISGHLNTSIRVFYIYYYDEKNNNIPIYEETCFALSNCGKLWTSREMSGLHRP
jgi:hypothetical protein